MEHLSGNQEGRVTGGKWKDKDQNRNSDVQPDKKKQKLTDQVGLKQGQQGSKLEDSYLRNQVQVENSSFHDLTKQAQGGSTIKTGQFRIETKDNSFGLEKSKEIKFDTAKTGSKKEKNLLGTVKLSNGSSYSVTGTKIYPEIKNNKKYFKAAGASLKPGYSSDSGGNKLNTALGFAVNPEEVGVERNYKGKITAIKGLLKFFSDKMENMTGVYCKHGKERSAFVLFAVLYVKEGLSKDNACEAVVSVVNKREGNDSGSKQTDGRLKSGIIRFTRGTKRDSWFALLTRHYTTPIKK